MSTEKEYFSTRVAVNIVIANMVGTGIFTSIGFQVLPDSIPDAFTILVAWVFGGIIALFGATAYSEVGSTFKESGGEFTFLSKLYHPVVGLASGWVSLIVGFSAASATLAIACAEYAFPVLQAFGVQTERSSVVVVVAGFLVSLITIIQLIGVRTTSLFQNLFTGLKIFLLILLISIPVYMYVNGSIELPNLTPTEVSWDLIFSMPFAGSLVWVMFSYSGWNASAYITENLKDPKNDLPKSLLGGTFIVTLFYLALITSFIWVCSFEEMAGMVDVGNLMFSKVLGSKAALAVPVLFTIGLLSGINAMFIAGPRLTQKMGEDYETLSFLGSVSDRNVPKNAILAQWLLCLTFVVFSNFKDIVEYVGLTLTVFSLFTVFGVFLIRKRGIGQNSVKTLGYPFTPIIFVAIHLWIIIYFALNDPLKSLAVLVTLIPAAIIYLLEKRRNKS